jgi:hypothetical protein
LVTTLSWKAVWRVLWQVFSLSQAALSSSSQIYLPRLILPTLHDPNALGLSVYIRSGQTEHLHVKERVDQYQEQATLIAACAIQVEEEVLAKAQDQVVVWMLVTDSQYVKTFITKTRKNEP